jgi:TetR/AcrR family transcriptional repressor of nem operon
MRYPPDQKAKARQAIMDAGARALRVNGFNGVGVDGLAAAAGVTSGAFYSNFPNKEALLEGVIDAFLGRPFVNETGSVTERREALQSWLGEYLAPAHRTDPASGCVMPTLGADVARAGPAVRDAYGRTMTDLIARIADVLGGPAGSREPRAASIVALMVGAIGVSRAMPDGAEAERVLENALKTALSLMD